MTSENLVRASSGQSSSSSDGDGNTWVTWLQDHISSRLALNERGVVSAASRAFQDQALRPPFPQTSWKAVFEPEGRGLEAPKGLHFLAARLSCPCLSWPWRL